MQNPLEIASSHSIITKEKKIEMNFFDSPSKTKDKRKHYNEEISIWFALYNVFHGIANFVDIFLDIYVLYVIQNQQYSTIKALVNLYIALIVFAQVKLLSFYFFTLKNKKNISTIARYPLLFVILQIISINQLAHALIILVKGIKSKKFKMNEKLVLYFRA